MKMKEWGRVALGAVRRDGWCGWGLVVLVILLVLFAGAGNSSTWAAPSADSLRQTVPTRTPVQPTETPVQPTETRVQLTPTPAPPTATSMPSSATPVQSTATPVQSTAEVPSTSAPVPRTPTSALIEAMTASQTSTRETSPNVSVSVTGASVPVNRTSTLAVSEQVRTQTPGIATHRVIRSATSPPEVTGVGNGGEGKATELWLYWIVVLLVVAVTFGRRHRK